MQGRVLTLSSTNHLFAFIVLQRTTNLQVLRPLHHGSLASRAPVVPLPRYRGAEGKALSFSRRTRARGLPTKATNVLPPNKIRGGGAPKRRDCPVGPRHASRCRHLLAPRARPRVQRNALALRRSTAVLASAPKRHSSIQAALHAMQCAGVTCALASRLSEAPRAPVVMPAGSMPGPPGSGSDEPPPAGTAPTPSVGVTG